jgi:hypothetical protein
MLSITFYPESDLRDYSEGVKEYENIWREDGEKIVKAWKRVTGLTFDETHINALIFEGISHSHPLSLRFDREFERKKSILVHELGHRLLYKKVKGGREATSLELHKLLFLVLYEVFTDLYGKDFADSAVEWDSNLPRPQYKEAWEWALNFSVEERKRKFQEILEGGYSLLN